jgi:sec-independent protein translocase protein TatB
MADSLIIMMIALVVFGPRKLPQIGRQIGKLMYEFRKASNDFKFQMEEELRNAEDADRRKQEEERLRALASAAPAPPSVAHSPVESYTASPYPDGSPISREGQYPPDTPAEAKPESQSPHLAPPSVGEQVPAARPWSPPAQTASVEPELASDSIASTSAAPAHADSAHADSAQADPAAAAQETHHG